VRPTSEVHGQTGYKVSYEHEVDVNKGAMLVRKKIALFSIHWWPSESMRCVLGSRYSILASYSEQLVVPQNLIRDGSSVFPQAPHAVGVGLAHGVLAKDVEDIQEQEETNRNCAW
jgi:hypothetical protein